MERSREPSGAIEQQQQQKKKKREKRLHSHKNQSVNKNLSIQNGMEGTKKLHVSEWMGIGGVRSVWHCVSRHETLVRCAHLIQPLVYMQSCEQYIDGLCADSCWHLECPSALNTGRTGPIPCTPQTMQPNYITCTTSNIEQYTISVMTRAGILFRLVPEFNI